MRVKARNEFEALVLGWARAIWPDVDEDWPWHRLYYVMQWARSHASPEVAQIVSK